MSEATTTPTAALAALAAPLADARAAVAARDAAMEDSSVEQAAVAAIITDARRHATVIIGLDCKVSDARIVMAVDHAATMAARDMRDVLQACRASSKGSITLPPHRYESLSRGRGWCRRGRGDAAMFAAKNDDGNYVVDQPGTWVVGGSYGYARKDSVTWTVRRITDAIWIAD